MTFYSCQNNFSDDIRIANIGAELVSVDLSENESIIIDDVVWIGNGLKEKIHAIRSNTTEFEYLIERGDLEKAFGDKKADFILTIITDFENLRIRLKYDEKIDKYHILGWSITET